MSIKIITDSTSDILIEDAHKRDIEIVPLSVSFGEETFIDKITITNEEFYEKLKTSDTMPTTTLVSPQQFIEVFDKYENDTIIGIFLSKKLSGTFQSATIAKEESTCKNIYLIDSGSVTIGTALLVEIAVRMRDDGKTAQEIVDKVTELAEKLEIYAVIDTLKYLVKGGRLSSAHGVVGTVLGIKPIITLKDGTLSNIGKERGMKKAVAFISEKIKGGSKIDSTMPIFFGHSDNLEDLKLLTTLFDNGDSQNLTIGSVVGAHSGPKAIAIAFINK